MCNMNYASQFVNGDTEKCCPHGQEFNATTGICKAASNCLVVGTGSANCLACTFDK